MHFKAMSSLAVVVGMFFVPIAVGQDEKQPPSIKQPPLDPVLLKFQKLGGTFRIEQHTVFFSITTPLGWAGTSITNYPQFGLTAILASGPKEFLGLPVVKLNLYGTKTTDADLKALSSLGQLQSLMLNRTPITDAGLANVSGLSQLNELSLSATNITDAGLVHLKGLQNLETLILIGTKISDAGLAHLKELPKLQNLHLNKTNVTNNGLAQLKELKTLRLLGLRETKVTPAGFAVLKGGVPALQIIDLTNNGVTEEDEKLIRASLPKAKVVR